jgi:hypothetical protein
MFWLYNQVLNVRDASGLTSSSVPHTLTLTTNTFGPSGDQNDE